MLRSSKTQPLCASLQVQYARLRCKSRQEIGSFVERCGEFQEAFSHKELDAQQQSMLQQLGALKSQVIWWLTLLCSFALQP